MRRPIVAGLYKSLRETLTPTIAKDITIEGNSTLFLVMAMVGMEVMATRIGTRRAIRLTAMVPTRRSPHRVAALWLRHPHCGNPRKRPRADMAAAAERLSRQFESSEDMQAAIQAVRDAQWADDAAVANVTRAVKQDTDYEQAEAKVQQAARNVELARAADYQFASSASNAQPPPISLAVIKAAQEKLKAASQATAIAADRIETAPAVTHAREKLEAATDRLNGLKAKFDERLL